MSSSTQPPILLSSPEALAVIHARKCVVESLAEYNRAWSAMFNKSLNDRAALQARCAALQAENAMLRAQLTALRRVASAAPPVRVDDNDNDDDSNSSSAAGVSTPE